MTTPLDRIQTPAQRVLAADDAAAAGRQGRAFADGTRPVIRWIKGDGLDDDVTRAAIGQATRLFGDAVDYCLCTQGIDAARARRILEWAVQPVEWWPVTAADNPALAALLDAAGCPPARYGYWWKWFPDRVRPAAPEWILDGDMVVTGPPAWWDDWIAGRDPCRASQDDTWPADALYGRYADLIDPARRLYSGLVSLPPGLSCMPAVLEVLARRPLEPGHDGSRDLCEQGVVAAALQSLGARPVPLCDFPFARAFEADLDFGRQGDRGTAWGYHFGHAFRGPNPHFASLAAEGIVLNLAERPSLPDRFRWLGSTGQWGVPGWGSPAAIKALVAHYAAGFAGRRVLDLGTSRGGMAALLATLGCRVTAVDRHDRGAAANLAGLDCAVVRADAAEFLRDTADPFDLVVADLHGNAHADWAVLWPLLRRALAPGGMVLLCNATLSQMPEWRAEAGIPWLLEALPPGFLSRLHAEHPPGLAVVTAPDAAGRASPLPPPPTEETGPAPAAPPPRPRPRMTAEVREALAPVLPQPFRPKQAPVWGRWARWWRAGAGMLRQAANTLPMLMRDAAQNAEAPAARLLRVVRARQPGQGRSLLLYAHYAPHGRVSPMVLLQLRDYARLGFRTVFVTSSPTIGQADWHALRGVAEVVAVRRNFGRDFGAWADAARALLPDGEDWEEVLIANDSVIGPLAPLDPVFARFRAAGDGVFGMTEGVQLGPHLQSYFVLARGGRACAELLGFLRGLRLSDSKTLTIRRGEIGLTRAMRAARLPIAALHGYAGLERAAAASPAMREGLAAIMPRLARQIGPSGRQLPLRRALMDLPLNPTHHFAVLLVRSLGFPFLKTEFVLANPTRHPEALDWQDLIPPDAPCSAAMAREHLALQVAGVAPGGTTPGDAA